MMRFSFLLIACLVPLAGCMGVPEDAADFGDHVFLQVTFRDAATGEVLLNEQASNFAVGSGDSGFGFEFERQFIGHREGDSIGATLSPMEFSGEVKAQRWFGIAGQDPIFLEGELERARFETAFGPASVGMEFQPPSSFYGYRVTDLTEATVTYIALPEDGQRNEVPAVGSVLITHVVDDRMEQELEPVVGATFVVAPPSPQIPTTVLNLDPGSYEVLGADDDSLLLAYHPTQYPDLIGRELAMEAQLNSIQKGPGIVREPDENGNVGVRTSPQLNGDPEQLQS